ncbi:MAG TPA: putative motility protein [Clostridia bacterium]|jgi:Xaa-Pro aminopeptidase|nr:putative motility protein [Clostridia bacterium]
MNITSLQVQNIQSIKSAINIANLSKVMNQDAKSVDQLMKSMEHSVTPHKGSSIDIKL